jgi:hypothetical protein
MAKKDKEVTEKPKVTQIPLPISDSALVIDLPDGQKLVVGKMNHGTVIEVATWRGTGRPDSRTNRMMLGMSNTEIESQIQEEEERQATQSASGWRARLQMAPGIFKAVLLKIKTLLLNLFSKLPKRGFSGVSNKKLSSIKALPFLSKIKPSESHDDEIQAWLDKVTAKSTQKRNALTPAVKSASKAKKSSASKVKSARK